ncbi:hypothetical protein ACIKP9_06965 [Methylobacillus methanolivorans]|uniref:Uncharacterized protein n=1 Tax=Methylobacillus methanolivorans TaxID=1848927 RepID=A0ABW8GKS0_9PROT
MRDKQMIGVEQHELILKYINRFGWLTSRMIKKLVYDDSSQGLALARRALVKMIDNKLVIKRGLPNGGEAYLLGTKGAAFLRSLNINIDAQSGARLKLGNPVHRACSNWFLIDELVDNKSSIWTEFEIQNGTCPIHQIFGKIPDGLIRSDSEVEWVEVENSWKNRMERERIVRFCADMLGCENYQPLSSDFYLVKMIIVCSNKESSNYLVRSFIEAFEAGVITEAVLSEVEIVFAEVSSNLMPPTSMIRANLWYDLIQRV